jgi:hypothetical protein
VDSSLPCVITNYALTQLLKDHTTARDFLGGRGQRRPRSDHGRARRCNGWIETACIEIG